jgi:hypothetical protein
MASANVTVRDNGLEFEADDTQHTASLSTAGGNRTIKNTGTKPAVISFENMAGLALSQPAAAGSLYLASGAEEKIPNQCRAISFLAAAAANNTYLRISARN